MKTNSSLLDNSLSINLKLNKKKEQPKILNIKSEENNSDISKKSTLALIQNKLSKKNKDPNIIATNEFNVQDDDQKKNEIQANIASVKDKLTEKKMPSSQYNIDQIEKPSIENLELKESSQLQEEISNADIIFPQKLKDCLVNIYFNY